MEKIFFMLHLDFSSQCTVRDFVNTDVRMNAVLFTHSWVIQTPRLDNDYYDIQTF